MTDKIHPLIIIVSILLVVCIISISSGFVFSILRKRKTERLNKIATELFEKNEFWVDFYSDYWTLSKATKFGKEYRISIKPPGTQPGRGFTIAPLFPSINPFIKWKSDTFERNAMITTYPYGWSDLPETYYFIKDIDTKTGKVGAEGLILEKINDNEIKISGLFSEPISAMRSSIIN